MTKMNFEKPMGFIAALGLSLVLLGVGACSQDKQTITKVENMAKEMIPLSTLETVLAGDWRTEQAKRDQFRHPKQTLEFFGLKPGQNIIEINPGGSGWYTNILAPYSKATGGSFSVAGVYDSFAEKFSDAETYGNVNILKFGADSSNLAQASADMILTFRSVHNWNGRGYAQQAFDNFYESLKPGGILGVVEHRLPESVEQDLKTSTGYVQASFVKAMAKKSGFEFVAASEINANSKDTANHPFGVWTLPPVSAKARRGQEPAADFDGAKYLAIGESDRFTLKFRKPN